MTNNFWCILVALKRLRIFRAKSKIVNVDRDGAVGKRGDDVRLVGNARQDEVVVRLLRNAQPTARLF